MIEVLKAAILDIGSAVIWAALSIGAAYLTAFIKGWADEKKAEIAGIKNENAKMLLTEAFERAEYLAGVTVTAIEQTVAGDLREQVREGIKSREALLELGRKAAADIYHQLSPKYIEAISDGTGDINAYLSNLVEKKVLQLKN